MPTTSCFNVTAPVKARKSSARSVEMPWIAALQCDRACEGAEMWRFLGITRKIMELQCDRACEGAEMSFQGSPEHSLRGFNVTAPVKARKWATSSVA